ncbi:helix-turn-helix domain-containing protein [Cellvibrio sp. OA-2007]|uniref:helix-turn-helix domain-containing protein n=1 Tax=Cellvibrio sp. OA-2007 TaxID=529823 RepID=UPI000A00F179|nr:helix-turn-helix transcriptional regulator [Cellvibrio sp. OA-2007]
MSTLARRIRAIRTALHMTREAFGDKIGIPGRTIEGIESEGRIPRGDVLEGIAKALPQFAYWLLTQKTDGAQHIAPLGAQVPSDRDSYLRVIDHVDARGISRCIVKENLFRKVVFIQSKSDESNLAVLIEINQTNVYHTTSASVVNVIWIGSGILNFDSDHGGRNSLIKLREELSKIDHDLVLKAEYFEAEDSIVQSTSSTLIIAYKELLKPNENTKNYERFIAWKNGEEPYDN